MPDRPNQNSPAADTAANPVTDSRQPQRLRLPLCFRRLQVRSSRPLTPAFIRIELAGEELDGFNSPGFDDHAKLFFPDPDGGDLRLPTMTQAGPVWPDGPRPIARDYTPRHHDRQAGTLTLDFVLHEAGPATDWARSARPGDWLGVGGPRGSMLIPTGYDWHLLVGDETALPAIARRLEELPADAHAIVVAEVDRPGDAPPLASPARLDLHWCHRQGAAPGSSPRLLAAVRALTLPAGDGYAWVACESGQARALRQHLTGERGLDPRRVKAAAYWRLGAEAVHEQIGEE